MIRPNKTIRLIFPAGLFGALLCLSPAAHAQIVREPINTGEPPREVDYRVPAGDVDELRSFIKRLLSVKNADLVADELEEYQKQAAPAIAEAAQRMLRLLPDSDSATARWAQAVRLQALAEMVQRLPAEGRRELVEEVQKYLNDKQPDQPDVVLARTLGDGLSGAGEKQLAAQAFSGFADVFASSQLHVGNHGKAADFFANSAQRLRQVDRPLELKGEDLAGKPFSLSSLRGKVVLIHFTQLILGSGKTYQAHERMVELYQEDRQRGLEIVYVSTDGDQAEVRKKVAERDIPWVVLDDSEHRLLQRFSITRLPYTMLVDRLGVLLAAEAGHDVDRLLAGQLGGKER